MAALIQIEYETTSDWAQRRKLPHTSYADLVEKPEVQELISGEINRLNEQLARVEQIKAFRFFPKELHQDDGELTPTQKVKRKAILDEPENVPKDQKRRKYLRDSEHFITRV